MLLMLHIGLYFIMLVDSTSPLIMSIVVVDGVAYNYPLDLHRQDYIRPAFVVLSFAGTTIWIALFSSAEPSGIQRGAEHDSACSFAPFVSGRDFQSRAEYQKDLARRLGKAQSRPGQTLFCEGCLSGSRQ